MSQCPKDGCSPADPHTLPSATANIPLTVQGPVVVAAGKLHGLPAELVNHETYEVLEEIRRGGIGVVYLARNKPVGRLEVLKVVQAGLAEHPDFRRRFADEVKHAARAEHENIVLVHCAFPPEAPRVLVMEYIEGENLQALVERNGPRSVEEACVLARQVALGLAHAHAGGLVHRDIKPSNVVRRNDGVAKIVDFGLAKAVSEQGEKGHTKSGELLGTPDYMAPEQADDAKNADIRADIYSLGCTLYFLLVGRPPFDGRSAFEVAQAHHTQAAPPLLGVPAGLNDLVARMMAKRPEQRPQTPAEVAKELLPYCQGESRDGLLPAARRGRLGPVLAGVAVVLALVAIGVGLWAAGVFGPRGSDYKGALASVAGPATERPPDQGKKSEKKDAPTPVVKDKEPVGMKLMRIPLPKRPFKMGSPKGEKSRVGAEFQHEVELTRAFSLAAHEVTQKQFKAVMGYNPSYFSADGTAAPAGKYGVQPAEGMAKMAGMDTSEFPVENVSHDEAVEFCRLLTQRERKAGKIAADQEYRLPTEAEWEYSCRGGAPAYQIFHFGDNLASGQANFKGTHPYGGAKGEYLERTRRVGSYAANGYGLYDMHGNVQEWCADYYDAKIYEQPPYPRRNPSVGGSSNKNRVVRGGSWFSEGRACRSAARHQDAPANRSQYLGFRVALVPAGGK